MGRTSRFLRLCAFLSVLFFATNVFAANVSAAGYSCPTYKKYTSCNPGYYMTVSGKYNGTATVGNACTICPEGSYCTGGTKNKTTCPAGSVCSTTGLSEPDGVCTAGYYCPSGSTSATARDCDTGTTTASTNNYWTSEKGAGARTNCFRSITLSKNGGYGTVSLTNPVTGFTNSATGNTNVTTQCYYNTPCALPTITDQTGGQSHGVTNGLYSDNYTYCGGWSTSSTVQSACPSTPTSSVTVTSTEASVTYYAVLTGDDRTIVLNNNSATSAGSTAVYTRYNVDVYLDEAHTKSMTTTTNPITLPTKTGYTFDGYASSTADCTSSTRYISKTGYRTSILTTTTALTTLYACWTENKYTVSFDANGGSGGQTDDVTAIYGAAMPAISTTAPTKRGYTFNGWYDATSGGTQYYTAAGASARTWNKTEDATLYAQWTANCNKITLDNTTLGGTGGTTSVYKKTASTAYYSDSACSTTITAVTVPSKTNATYGGTYTTDATSGGTQCINSSGTLNTSTDCTVTGETTWYARYSCNANYLGSGTTIAKACSPSIYTVTLKNYDDSATHSTIYEKYATGWYSDNIATTTLSAASVPTRSGYKFRGFYTAKQTDLTANGGSGTRRITASGGLPGNTTFTANASLYAAWAKDCTKPANGTCSLTINSDGTAAYTASCNTGYTVSGANTATPSCSANCNAITLDANGGTAGTVATLYKKTGSGTWYTNSTTR